MQVNELFSLQGKTALVTGGAGMYGRQLGRGMAEAGAKTYIASRNREALDKVIAEEAERGLELHALVYDQADEASILKLKDELLEREGHLDVLVNNTVSRPMIPDAYHASADKFAESMQVNATGLFVITRAFGDAMAERQSGSIVNIGSIHGMIAPDPSLYKGTEHSGWYPDYFFHKSGVINFTRFIASYYGDKGVRCNCVSPGGYQTEAHDDTFLDNYADKTMLRRMSNDDDLKGVVVFLASAAAGYITGANLPVDAGYTAK